MIILIEGKKAVPRADAEQLDQSITKITWNREMADYNNIYP